MTGYEAEVIIAESLGLSRPYVTPLLRGTCPGGAEYGHGLTLKTVHSHDCCARWHQACLDAGLLDTAGSVAQTVAATSGAELDERLRRGLKALAAPSGETSGERAAKFAAMCRRHDADPEEQRRIEGIVAEMEAEDAMYDAAMAALDCDELTDLHTFVAKLPVLDPAEAGTGDSLRLLACLLDRPDRTAEAAVWYSLAACDGDTRAGRRLTEMIAAEQEPGDE